MVMVIRVILALHFLLVVHLAWGIHLLTILQALGILLLVKAFILLHCLLILAKGLIGQVKLIILALEYPKKIYTKESRMNTLIRYSIALSRLLKAAFNAFLILSFGNPMFINYSSASDTYSGFVMSSLLLGAFDQFYYGDY